MAIEVQGSATGTTAAIAKAVSAGPAAVINGAAVYALAHPLGLLALTGAALVMLGLYDAVHAIREKKQAAETASPTADLPETMPGRDHSEEIW